jgi:hypothetical protein
MFTGLKWLIAAVILLEIFCFLVITVSNYII